jgi:hypothetical protein
MISRSTFNAAVKPLIKIFGGKEPVEIYEVVNNYLTAMDELVLRKNQIHDVLFQSTPFKGIVAFFPVVAAKVKDRFGSIYSVDNFAYFLAGVGDRIKPAKFTKAGNAYTPLVDHLKESLSVDFTL